MIQGNLIGTQIDGVSPLGNGADGILPATNGAAGSLITLGRKARKNMSSVALDPGDANTIAFNGRRRRRPAVLFHAV